MATGSSDRPQVTWQQRVRFYRKVACRKTRDKLRDFADKLRTGDFSEEVLAAELCRVAEDLDRWTDSEEEDHFPWSKRAKKETGTEEVGDEKKKADEMTAEEVDKTAEKEVDETAEKEVDELTATKKEDEMTAEKEVDELTAEKEVDELTATKEAGELTAEKEVGELTAKKEVDEVTAEKEAV